MEILVLQREVLDSNVKHKQEVRTGYGAYMWTNWIPFVGWLVFLVMTISRKEFKAVWLNRLVLQFIAGLFIGICFWWALDNEIMYVLLVYGTALILDILMANSINYSKTRQLIEAGYKPLIVDESDNVFVKEAMSRKVPWYQIIKFK